MLEILQQANIFTKNYVRELCIILGKAVNKDSKEPKIGCRQNFCFIIF